MVSIMRVVREEFQSSNEADTTFAALSTFLEREINRMESLVSESVGAAKTARDKVSIFWLFFAIFKFVKNSKIPFEFVTIPILKRNFIIQISIKS